jgi:hypothetical protein
MRWPSCAEREVAMGNVALAKNVYDSFAGGDIAAVLGTFEPNIRSSFQQDTDTAQLQAVIGTR